jgi:hypothetical protein
LQAVGSIRGFDAPERRYILSPIQKVRTSLGSDLGQINPFRKLRRNE